MRNDKYYENPKTYNEFKHNQNVAELKLKNAARIITVKILRYWQNRSFRASSIIKSLPKFVLNWL